MAGLKYCLSLSVFVIFMLINSLDTKTSRHKVQLLPGHLLPRFEFLQNCEDASSLGLKLINSTFSFFGTNIALNAAFRFPRTVPTITEAVLTINNCFDKTSVTCQLFQTWRFGKESCSILEMESQIWSPILQNIHPPLRCPLLQGDYVLRNGTLDMKLLLALPFPLEKYFWRVREEGYDPIGQHACIEFGVQFIRSRT